MDLFLKYEIALYFQEHTLKLLLKVRALDVSALTLVSTTWVS